MAVSGGDIRAGRAFVELYVKNSALMKGLAEAQKRLRDFGNGIAVVGKWMMGLGTAAIAPFVAMAARFEHTGSALNDMSARTGMTTEALSELGYAAGQTGAEMEDVETAVRKMQKAIGDAAEGGEAGTKALSHLGLTIGELRGLSPDKQFELIASRLAAIKDPTQQAAAAMEIFGKTGTKLLPMISDLKALRERAQELGLVMSGENAAAADALGDALNDLKKTILGAGNGIMASLAPALTQFVRAATNAVLQVKQWATDNAGLIITVMKVAAGVAAAGAGLFIFGKAIMGVGAILGGLHSFIIWAVGGVQLLIGVLGMTISPALAIGVAITAIGAALIYLARNTAPVQAVGNAIAVFADGIRGMVKTAVGDVMTAWGGITDALAAGDIGAAIKVVTATITLEWTRVTTWLQETWQGFLVVWSNITTSIAGFMIDATAAIKSAWYSMMGYLTKLWEHWKTSTFEEGLADWLAPLFAKMQGVSVEDTRKALHEDFARARQAQPQRDQEIDAQTSKEKERIEADRKAQQKNLAEDKRASDDARAAAIAAKQKELDDAIKARDDAVAAAKESRRKAEADQGGGTKPAFQPPEIDLEGLKAAKAATTVTFSASAAMGMGGGIQERIARACERTFKFVGEQTTVLKNIEKNQVPLVMKG